MKVKKLISGGIKIVLAGVVMLFLGLKSYDFFLFTTPEDEWYYAILGFGLTGIGLIAYLIMFMWDADSALKRTIALVMMFVCGLGEVVTAGFGLQVSAWQQAGYSLVEKDFNAMILFIQALGFVHALALIAYYAGDKIAEAFSDEDGDGIPNFADRDYRKNKNNQFRSQFQPNQQTTKQERIEQDNNHKQGENFQNRPPQ